MKVAIFNLSKSYSNQGWNRILSTTYTFHSCVVLEDNNIQELLENNISILLGNQLYIKVPENTQIREIFDPRDLLENDNVILLDEFSVVYSLLGRVGSIQRGVYKIEGTPLFQPGIVHSSAGFKKIFGKNFSIFKLV